MRKSELIYLHALLAQVHECLVERGDVPETFTDYERMSVGPYQIQHQKDDHEAAIRLLATRIAEELSDRHREPEVQEA